MRQLRALPGNEDCQTNPAKPLFSVCWCMVLPGGNTGEHPDGAIGTAQQCHLHNVAIKRHYPLNTESRCIPRTVIGSFC